MEQNIAKLISNAFHMQGMLQQALFTPIEKQSREDAKLPVEFMYHDQASSYAFFHENKEGIIHAPAVYTMRMVKKKEFQDPAYIPLGMIWMLPPLGNENYPSVYFGEGQGTSYEGSDSFSYRGQTLPKRTWILPEYTARSVEEENIDPTLDYFRASLQPVAEKISKVLLEKAHMCYEFR